MTWNVVLVKSAEKQLRKAPAQDATRLARALRQMQEDPFAGDIVFLKGQQNTLRRRVGNWRIIFQIIVETKMIVVKDIVRRSSTTYS